MRGGWLRVIAVVALVTVTAGSAQQPPSLVMTPSCSATQPLRLPMTIAGRNFSPGDFVRAVFDFGPGRENLPFGSADVVNDGSFQMTRTVSAELEPDPQVGGYRVAVFPGESNNPVERVFRVPCPVQQPPTTTTTTSRSTTTTTTPPGPGFNPTLTMNPSIGPAGFVATATGTNWPPGAVTLGWNAGGDPIAAVADSDGSFSVPVLVLPGTTLGVQGLLGSGPGGVGASGTFLVVPNSAGPPIWNH